jgi:hypothetical protein
MITVLALILCVLVLISNTGTASEDYIAFLILFVLSIALDYFLYRQWPFYRKIISKLHIVKQFGFTGLPHAASCVTAWFYGSSSHRQINYQQSKNY